MTRITRHRSWIGVIDLEKQKTFHQVHAYLICLTANEYVKNFGYYYQKKINHKNSELTLFNLFVLLYYARKIDFNFERIY